MRIDLTCNMCALSFSFAQQVAPRGAILLRPAAMRSQVVEDCYQFNASRKRGQARCSERANKLVNERSASIPHGA